MKKYLKWFICIILLSVFFLLCYLVGTKQDIYLDRYVYKFLSKYISSDLTNIVKCITYIGSAIIVIGITLFTAIFFKNKKYSIFMSIDLIVITVLQVFLKNVFVRTRPIDINLITETGYSFPSGHSLTSMAFYGFIIYLIFNSKLASKLKRLYITLFSLLIFITGLSRIYLGVHFFSDVMGGFSFSLAYLIIYTSVIRKKLY